MKRFALILGCISVAAIATVAAGDSAFAKHPKRHYDARAQEILVTKAPVERGDYVQISRPTLQRDPTLPPYNLDGCKGTVTFPACSGGN